MTQSLYAHIIVYFCIAVCGVGVLGIISMVYHVINVHIFMPLLRKVEVWRENTRAMDTTSARYHKVIR